jgi:hypothetical protein
VGWELLLSCLQAFEKDGAVLVEESTMQTSKSGRSLRMYGGGGAGGGRFCNLAFSMG